MSVSKKKLLPLLMWSLPLSFFTFQFILRIWPSLMMENIMNQFSINATEFGFLASSYYYGYAAMQIPIAILLERYGTRHILFICAGLCGVATIAFCYTNNWHIAIISRFMIGAGSAVGFLGTSKVISEWFSKKQYAKMVGLSFSFGLLGAIYGGLPISILVQKFSWQQVLITLGIISICLGILSLLLLKTPLKIKSNSLSNDENLKISDFKKILRMPLLWFLAISNLLMVGSLEGFADVWGVNYLMEAFQYNKGNAAGLISMIFVGMLFGGPILAYCAKYMGNYTVITLAGFGMASLLIFLLSTNGNLSWYLVAILLFITGILCCYQVIVFDVGNNLVNKNMLGVTVAFLNCINMIGGSFFHSIIGTFMDFFWIGDISDNGSRLYTVETYNNALLIIPFCAIAGSIIVYLLGIMEKKKKIVQNHRLYLR